MSTSGSNNLFTGQISRSVFFSRAALTLLTLGILYLSLASSPPSDGLGWDKANHAAAMFFVAMIASQAFRPAYRAVCFGGLYALFLGGIIEVLQMACTTNRQAEWGDLIADAVGVSVATLLLTGWRLLVRDKGRKLSFTLLLFMTLCKTVAAEEITVVGELTGFSSRLLSESSEFATTPFSLKDGTLFWTIGIGGAIGLSYAYDSDIQGKLQGGIRSHGMDKATDIGALIGNPYLHLGVAALVYTGGLAAGSPKWKETGEMLVEALALADGATLLIKEGSGRGRPTVSSRRGDFRPFQFKDDYDSFPSMHTASSFAMASVLAHRTESMPVAIASYTVATFVGFSRMYQNKHWASDVLLGAIIGELAGQVVTACHADNGRRLVLLPGISGESVTMNLLYRF